MKIYPENNRIYIKDILVEMPKCPTTLTPETVKKLEQTLKTKLSTDFNGIETIPLMAEYAILQGSLNDIKDWWAAIVKHPDDKESMELCFGSTLRLTALMRGIPAYQIMLSCKYTSQPRYAASQLYIGLVNRFNIALFSDERVTNDGKGIWYELLTRPNLDREGIKIFVFDKLTRKEITNYGNIDDLFGIDDKFENILVGIKPI
jgi:hypothetical protein